MNKIEYLKRIKTSSDLRFFTKSGLHIATGYDRIVIGKRGAYIEFSHIVIGNVYIPKEQLYRLNNPTVYYDEYRTVDISNVKIYWQKKTVKYADYLINKWYISPNDLVFDMKENKIGNYFMERGF